MAAITTVNQRSINITGDYVVHSLSASANLTAENIKSDHLLYSNGSPYVFTTNAAGTNTQIQFNDGNNFAGSANLTFDKTSNTLTVAYLSGDGSNVSNVNAKTLNGHSDTYFASTSYVDTAVTNLIASAPGALDTLNELANALGNDASFSTSVTNSLANKLSTSNFASTANTWISTQTTSNLGEGTNLYYTDSRANSAIDARVTQSFLNTLSVTANIANVAYSVDGANVTGIVANATHANVADSANSVSGSNVDGTVANATYAETSNVAYSVSVANVSGIGNIATINLDGNSSNILYGNGSFASAPVTYGDSNVAAYLPTYTGNLTPGNLSIGVSNLQISGGTANYVLTTDGAGNLSWAAVTSGGGEILPDVVVDTFVADGVTTSYTLSTTPISKDYLIINMDGVFQLRDAYVLTNSTIVFGSVPAEFNKIEVSTFVPGLTSGGSSANANLIINGTSNVVVANNGNVSTSVAGNANVLVVTGNSVVTAGSILPSANVTYDLGSATNRFKDLYLSNNTIYLGDTVFSANSVLPFDLHINAEILTIQIAAPESGNDIHWLWTWETSTLPYARTTITNQQQVSVPLYKQGIYQINNFANEQTGTMTQRHVARLKWLDGAGLDNLVSWSVDAGNVVMAHPSINGGANTTVQRLNITVPSSVVVPTLVAPNVTYDVSHANVNTFTIGNMGVGENRNLGPVYRGGTYTFNLDVSLVNDPFYITTDNGTGFVANSYVGEYTSGVTGSRNDGTTGKTTLTFVVPNDAPDTLYYQSATNANMRGAITIKDLAVETNVNGNYVLYLQHMKEGHKTPIEIRPIPSMVNQMCLVYDEANQRFVPQDMATYVENTPSFKNKIREVAGTATLIAPDGVAVVPTVLVVEDVSYLPLVDNKNGDIAFDAYTDTIYVWDTNAWKNSKPTYVATVTANAQPNITSVGTLTSLTASGNITGNYFVGNGSQLTGLPSGYTNSNVAAYLPTYTGNLAPGNITLPVANLKLSGGAADYVLKTDGAGNLAWSAQTGGTQNFVREYVWRGGLTENVGTLRYYIHTASTLTGIYAYLVSAGLTQSKAIVKKNGVSINTITIPANTLSVSQSGLNISLVAGDYLTIDITQSSSASDLYINFIYQG